MRPFLTRVLATVSLAAAALAASASPALATPFGFQFADTISLTSIAGLAAGQSAVITVVLDNGSATNISQTWTAANLQSVTFNFNNGGLVTTFSSPFDGGLENGQGSFTTDATGALTGVMSSWYDGSVNFDFTTTGTSANFAWFLNGANHVYAEFVPRNTFDVYLTNVGNMLSASNWRPVAVNPVPEPGSLLLLGGGVVGLGVLARRRTRSA